MSFLKHQEQLIGSLKAAGDPGWFSPETAAESRLCDRPVPQNSLQTFQLKTDSQVSSLYRPRRRGHAV